MAQPRRQYRASPRPDRAAARAVQPPAVLAGLLALGIGASNAFRGLYFPPQQMVALIIAAVLVWGFLALRFRQARVFLRSPADYAALGLLAAYLISAFVAVRPNGAVQSLLLWSLYVAVFFMAAELVQGPGPARGLLLAGLLLGGLVAAATGLAAAAGAPITGAFVGHRIYTLIQYPDAAAAYVAAVMFIALGLKASTARLLPRLACGALAAVLLLVFVFALSRGAFIVLVPVAAAFVVALWRRAWADGLASLVIAGVAVAAGAVPYLRGLHRAAAHAAHAASTPPGAAAVVEAVVGVLAVSALLDWAWSRVRQLSWERWRVPAIIVGAALVVGLGAAVAVVLRGKGIVGRLGQLSTGSYNAWSRLRWMADALRLFVRRPVLGWGGGGWAAAYQAFQSYNYSSTQVHNGWLQIGVESGAVGLLVWIALWACICVCTVAAYRRAAPGQRPVVVGLAAAAAMIGGHGLIDFTLSLGAISLTLWTVFGLLRGMATSAPAAAPAPVRLRHRTAEVPPPAPRPPPAGSAPRPRPATHRSPGSTPRRLGRCRRRRTRGRPRSPHRAG